MDNNFRKTGYRIFGRGFQLFIFLIFNKIRAGYSEYSVEDLLDSIFDAKFKSVYRIELSY